MPGNVARILKEMNNPDISIGTLVDFISLDQALAAQVLQMSNSVSLGYPRTCSTLREAIMQIGLGRLKTILLASSASEMLKQRLGGYRLGEGELWHHSLVTAVASEWLAQSLRYPNTEEAYISGLLHDIGKLFLDQFVVKEYAAIVDYGPAFPVAALGGGGKADRDRPCQSRRADRRTLELPRCAGGCDPLPSCPVLCPN